MTYRVHLTFDVERARRARTGNSWRDLHGQPRLAPRAYRVEACFPFPNQPALCVLPTLRHVPALAMNSLYKLARGTYVNPTALLRELQRYNRNHRS